MNSLIAEIKNEIMEKFAEWEGDIEEFKYYYGNHDKSIYYYDFTFGDYMVLDIIEYILNCLENNGIEANHSVMKRMLQPSGLKIMVLYWVMEEIDFYELRDGF